MKKRKRDGTGIAILQAQKQKWHKAESSRRWRGGRCGTQVSAGSRIAWTVSSAVVVVMMIALWSPPSCDGESSSIYQVYFYHSLRCCSVLSLSLIRRVCNLPSYFFFVCISFRLLFFFPQSGFISEFCIFSWVCVVCCLLLLYLLAVGFEPLDCCLIVIKKPDIRTQSSGVQTGGGSIQGHNMYSHKHSARVPHISLWFTSYHLW